MGDPNRRVPETKGNNMQKTTKGAFAAAAAATLLLGGAGSLAYWTTAGTVSGSSITSGKLALSTPGDCGAGWTIDGGAAYGATSKLVPGDVLTKTCTFVVTAEGDHLKANVTASTPSMSNDFGTSLTADVTEIQVDGASRTQLTSADNGKNVAVTVEVSFDGGAGNSTKNLTSTLNDITVTATQVHS